jgi:D-alanine-D-alanine ligase
MKVNPSGPSSWEKVVRQIKIWVLVPHLPSDDPNIQYYYDFSQSLAEYTSVFSEWKADWVWQPVTLQDFTQVIDKICASANGRSPFILNLCDGDEINGSPGISVVKYLEEKGASYSGADEFFYHVTTSKATMKKAFDQHGVPTPAWEQILSPDQDITGIFQRLGSPLILKPAVSGGSMGVSVKNVVHNEQQLLDQVNHLYNGYHGWDLTLDGLIAEEFINGPEFTTLIVGSSENPDECILYEPVERNFHHSLPDTEKFLSFDRLWEFYEKESAMPDGGNFYEYALPDKKLIPSIKQITLEAYKAVKGKSYARFDIRMDSKSGKLFVLEANAQCGLSEDENNTSIGAILRVSKKTFSQLIREIIQDALNKRKLEKPAKKTI